MLISPSGLPLENSNATCCIYNNVHYSYEDLHTLASQYYSQIQPYTLSLLVGANTFHCLAFYIAAISSASPLLLLPSTVSSAQLSSYISSFQPRQLFNLQAVKFHLDNALDFDAHLVVSNSFSKLDATSILPVLLLPTSGSTGTRKLVKVSHHNLSSNTKSIIHYLNITNKSRHITSLPFSYTYGLSCVNTHLSAGASIILNDFSILDKCFWKLVEDFLPTTFSGVPYTYETLFRFGKDYLSSLPIKNYTQAGGKLSKSLVEYFYSAISSFGGDFTVMYGQTEATARMSYLPSDSLPSKAGSIGIAIPNGSFILDYNNYYPSNYGFKVGELLYSGPNVTHGYASNIDDIYLATQTAPDTLKTGDLAYQDSDGYYFIVGRLSRFAKVSGIRISLDDLQLSLLDPDIVCVSNDKYIFFFHPPSVSSESILETLLTNFSLPSRTYRFIATDTIPRNESGKVVYSQLLDRISS